MAAPRKELNFQGVLAHLESSLGESQLRQLSRVAHAIYVARALRRLRRAPLEARKPRGENCGAFDCGFYGACAHRARPAVDKIRGRFTPRQRKIAGRPLSEIAERIDFLLTWDWDI